MYTSVDVSNKLLISEDLSIIYLHIDTREGFHLGGWTYRHEPSLS